MKTKPVDLGDLCNAGPGTALVPAGRDWSGAAVPARRLDGLPVGRQVFGRVPFRIPRTRGGLGKSFLLLRPEDPRTRTVKVRAKATALYLLHTVVGGELGRTPVIYTLHYADGGSATCPVTIGRDVADWLFPREFDNCLIGWTGYHRNDEFQKCVYVAELVNPRPREPLAAVSLRRHEPCGHYALLGLTLSGERPILRRIRRGSAVGLADYIDLDSDLLTLRDGQLRVEASLRRPTGAAVNGADLSAELAGRRYAFQALGRGRYRLCLPRRKGWRRYANTVTISARAGGNVVARRQAVLYANGYPRLVTPPHGRRPPQFIIIAFDDCKVLPGVASMLEIIESLRARAVRVVFTLYVSPCEPRSPDIEKVKLLYQRMYDLGCEFCNHTLNHNPGGVPWTALPRAGQVREIEGCRDWLRRSIHGLWDIYSLKSSCAGGGLYDAEFSRDLLRRQACEYMGNSVRGQYETKVPHPDVQVWPYKLGDEWSIDVGLVDGNAPPLHTPITKGFFTDYSGKFDCDVAEGIRMLRANFDCRYRSENRPPLVINSLHEWALGSYYPSHRNEKAILKGFLEDVLVTSRRTYPDTRVITLHELVQYMERGDLPATT